MPTRSQRPPANPLSFDARLEKLNRELAWFNPLIGGWPPAVKSTKQVMEVTRRWDKARALAEDLVKERPDSLEAKTALGDLLRMGHNMDVPGAAQASHQLLREVLKTDPDYWKAHLALACLLVTIHAEYAPRAEYHFLRVEELAAPEVIPLIYEGLGFACLYQDHTPEAITYFEKYLTMQKDPTIHTFLQRLKAGDKGQIVHK
jgi:hypothetical protein